MPFGPRLRRAARVALAALCLSGPALAYEQPAYEVHAVRDGYELRRYAPYRVVETQAEGGFDEARSAAFRRLFAYITGDNRVERTIAMTVPVLTGDAGAQVAMTAPVVTRAEGAGQWMQFMLPAALPDDEVPVPRDPAVRVRRVDAQWIAARSYSGRSDEAGYAKNAQGLLARLAADGVAVAGPPAFAVYNNPFTPWFLRRNEVLVPVQAP